MISLQPDEFAQRSAPLRLHRGGVLTVRFVRPDDADALQAYVRSLSARSRYNRFLGAVSELPKYLLDDFVHAGREDRFSIVATVLADGFKTIVGEARYAFHADTHSFEFGLSVDDRWQRLGIGAALLDDLECRADALGAVTMFGDTLRSNEPMIALAGKSGFVLRQHPDDWKLVRFDKQVLRGHAALACAGARGISGVRGFR